MLLLIIHIDIQQFIQRRQMEAFDPAAVYIVINQKNGLALQVPEQQNHEHLTVQMGPVNQNNVRQFWIMRDLGAGNYQIISAVPNRPLEAGEELATIGKRSGHTNTQMWFMDNSIFDKIRISLSKQKGKYLTYDSGRVRITSNCPIEEIDSWSFKKVENSQQLKSTCFFIAEGLNKIIDMPQKHMHEGYQLHLGYPDYGINQRFKILRAGEVFIIKSLTTGLNFDIKGENTNDGTPIILWHSTGGINQFWKIQDRGNSKYRISSWMDSEIQIGFKGSHIVASRTQKFLWEIHGHIPLF